jgi:hypothetical protein
MKKIFSLFLIFAIGYSDAQTLPQEYLWTATLKAVNEAGKPVAGVKVFVDFSVYKEPISGLTDTNGIFVASHRDASENIGIRAERKEYYPFMLEYNKGVYNPEKWNPSLTILLRRIGDPIPMYAKEQEMKFPKLDEPIGFDLMAGDWITPYGKGFHSDIMFKAHREIYNANEFKADLTVTFPNQGDGIVVAPDELVAGSEFKTSRVAAESGYKSELVLNYSNTGKPASVFGYFVRVRTELNPDGTVRSAFYGKIAGNFRFYVGTKAPASGMGFTYCLNPAVNDRNVEFNPKRNLIRDLSPLEEVKAP